MRAGKCICVALLALSIAGCGDLNKKPDLAAPAAVNDQAGETPKREAAGIPVFNIGDVEASLSFSLIPQEPLPPNIQVDTVKNAGGKISMVTVDIRPPFPAELIFNCAAVTTHIYKTQPLVVRGTIQRESDLIGEVQGVMGIDQVQNFSTSAQSQVDILLGLGEIPETFLVHGELEALLMPEGTDAGALALDAGQATPVATTIIMSNPVRVNFHKK